MTSQVLKNSILQFAVQGKLVLQDPYDEPATILLERIKAEKQHLIKEKKIKVEKSLASISEEELPFEIPDSWVWVRLGTLATIISKGTTPTGGKDQYFNEGIGFVRGENIGHDGKVHLENIKYINESIHYTSLSRSILEDKDLLICIAGTLGRCAIVEKSQLPLNTNQAVSFVRIISDKLVSLNFLQRIISSSFIQKNLLSQTKVTAIPNLTLEIISNCIIPLPPIAEQQRIVDKIEELMPLIEQYGSAEHELKQLNKKFPEQLKKSILQFAIQGKLVEHNLKDEPASILVERVLTLKSKQLKSKQTLSKNSLSEIKEEDFPFEIPENWTWVRLNDLTIKIGSGSTPTGGKTVYINEGVKFIRSQNVYNDGLRLDNVAYISEKINLSKKGSIVLPDDILLNITGASIGRCGLANKFRTKS
jgi:type I restriction enzyme, S subunit